MKHLKEALDTKPVNRTAEQIVLIDEAASGNSLGIFIPRMVRAALDEANLIDWANKRLLVQIEYLKDTVNELEEELKRIKGEANNAN